MAEKNNATCSICGKDYYLCLSCKDAMGLNPWKVHCCSSSHYQVYQAVRGFSTGIYNKEEFKSKLKNIDLTDLENYREHIKTLIKDVLKEKSNVKEKSEIVIEETEEIEVAEEIKPNRKKYSKVETE